MDVLENLAWAFRAFVDFAVTSIPLLAFTAVFREVWLFDWVSGPIANFRDFEAALFTVACADIAGRLAALSVGLVCLTFGFGAAVLLDLNCYPS